MKQFFLVFVVFALMISCTPAQKPVLPDLSKYEFEQTKEVVQLVYNAVSLIEQKGDKAFPEFRKKDSKWFYEDNYIFVWGMDGMRYVYPPDLSGEGKDMIALKDVNGKPIGKMFVNMAKQGEGWVFYEWNLPETEKLEWKSTFIKKAIASDGMEYLVGSGKYNMPMEKVFVENIVDDAITEIHECGLENAFGRFEDKTDKFIFLNSYVFVKSMEGVELFNPNSQDLVGKNIIDLQDANGKYFVKEELEILKTQDSCWMDYMWPKPGTDRPSKKLVYVKKMELDDEVFAVGAGYYLE
jgi:signal transduction histidine kinase